jgi:hypothetical protein
VIDAGLLRFFLGLSGSLKNTVQVNWFMITKS